MTLLWISLSLAAPNLPTVETLQTRAQECLDEAGGELETLQGFVESGKIFPIFFVVYHCADPFHAEDLMGDPAMRAQVDVELNADEEKAQLTLIAAQVVGEPQNSRAEKKMETYVSQLKKHLYNGDLSARTRGTYALAIAALVNHLGNLMESSNYLQTASRIDPTHPLILVNVHRAFVTAEGMGWIKRNLAKTVLTDFFEKGYGYSASRRRAFEAIKFNPFRRPTQN